jgi:alkanesulfonate monooxygenase SsuD/methylene tetrahydromethanopterin reductase-like flavin-dependent oxidoreductase (luciferase family)
MELGLAIDLGSEKDSVASRLAAARRLASLGEEHGFKSIWFGEGYPTGPGSFHLPSSLLMLAAISGSTSLTLGSGVALLPAWTPLRLAYDAALLDQACEGRLVLGVGVGTPALWRRFGLSTERMGDKVDEFLQTLRELWNGEVFPGPVRVGGPPIWMGGRIKRSALRAARWGDGWYAATSYRLSEIARMTAAYREACAALGKPPGPVAANRIVVVTDSPAMVEPYVDTLLAKYVRISSILGDDGRPVDVAGALALKDELVLVGSLEQVRSGLQRYAEAGVTHIQARVWPSDLPLEQVEATISAWA